MINILSIGKNLSTTQNLIIESVKNFCRTELKPRVISDYRNEVIDRNIFKKFGEMGIFGPTINGYGCLGESYKTYGLIAKEIEYIDSGYRSIFSVQSSLVMNPIFNYGDDIQLSQNLLIHFNIQAKFFIHSISTNLSKIITLI